MYTGRSTLAGVVVGGSAGELGLMWPVLSGFVLLGAAIALLRLIPRRQR
jgi:hypothetical protein